MEDYEQKYKEAIDKIKEFLKGEETIGKDKLEEILPELKEESKDERIRRELINAIKSSAQFNSCLQKHGFDIKEVLSWVEKQGEQNNLLNFDEAEKEKNDFVSEQFIKCRESFKEFKEFESYWLEYIGDDTYIGRSDNILNQKFHITPQQLFTLFTYQRCLNDNEKQDGQKPTDNAEPKFKAGDWVVNNKGMVAFIENLQKDIYGTERYYVRFANGNFSHPMPPFLDMDYHLWTIQDTKDGDVLEFVDHERVVIGIVSFVNERTGKVDVSCLLEDNKFKIGNFYALDTIKPHPATKEQRNLLFQKMKEAGYEWNAEKKELRKIEQKQDWSEEDEKMFNDAISLVYEVGDISLYSWLESIKERMKGE